MSNERWGGLGSDVIKSVNQQIKNPQTPEWGRVTLVALKDIFTILLVRTNENRRLLNNHLTWHDKRSKLVTWVWAPVVGAIAVAVTWQIVQMLQGGS